MKKAGGQVLLHKELSLCDWIQSLQYTDNHMSQWLCMHSVWNLDQIFAARCGIANVGHNKNNYSKMQLWDIC